MLRKSKPLPLPEVCPLNVSALPIQAVIFDLDGTLVDSEAMGLQVLHGMATSLGVQWPLQEMLRRFGGVPMAQCVAELARELPEPPPLDQALFVQQLRANMAERFKQGLPEIPGATDLLKHLQGIGMPFAIGTNGPREKAELTLGITGLRHFFGEHVYCAPEVGRFKPDPALFGYVAERLGCPPAVCAVVEDSLPGLKAGLDAGMQVFSLHSPQGLPQDVATRVHFIEGLPQLQARLPLRS